MGDPFEKNGFGDEEGDWTDRVPFFFWIAFSIFLICWIGRGCAKADVKQAEYIKTHRCVVVGNYRSGKLNYDIYQCDNGRWNDRALRAEANKKIQ